jgi:hypothetical protein
MKKENPIVKNVCKCTLCGSLADRYSNRIECQTNSCHVADLLTGIFSDLTPPNKN